MAIADTKQTVLQIVNEVQRKLYLSTTSTTTDTRHATILVDLLNDVIEEVSDAGDWVELRSSAVVSAVSGQGVYSLSVTGTAASINHIDEVRVSGRVPPLDLMDVSEHRRMASLNSLGTPSRFAVVGEDVSGNPTVGVWPRPNDAGKTLHVHFYWKPRRYTAGTDDAEIVPLRSRMLVQGLLAKAILEENGGDETAKFKVAYAEYQKMLKQSLNRFNSDTGNDVQFTPGWR